MVIATSGSTGVPKGVELAAAALRASAAASLRRIGAGPGERWLCCLPTFHIAGLGILVRSIVSGTEPVIAAKADPDVIAASGCAHLSLVPTQLRRLLAAGAARGQGGQDGPAHMAAARCHGDLLPAARAAGWPVVTTYGMSETCGGCVYDGVPLDGVAAAPGADGRILISGPVLFSGYRHAARAHRGRCNLAAGTFRTADLGYLGPDGRLVIRGRADDVINTGGEKVVPGEGRGCAGNQSAGRGRCRDRGPRCGVGVSKSAAFVVAADPAEPPGLGQLRAIVRQALSAHAAPRKVFVMPVLPLLPSGKPDRAALRALAESKSSESAQ